jgi:putative tryptophan/tyrosine transport system substrate-binding protein
MVSLRQFYRANSWP